MNLVWSKTGDELKIDVYNYAVIEYWFEKLTEQGKNDFALLNKSNEGNTLDHNTLSDKLNSLLKEINVILEKMLIKDFKEFENRDFLDQNVLNTLHEIWVKTHQKYPNLKQFFILSKKNKEWDDINLYIHRIEYAHTIYYTNTDKYAWQIENKFEANILTMDRFHVELGFQNLGRSTYQKWLNFDNNVHDSDTNNFTHIGGEIEITLGRSREYNYPKEYIQWCNDHRIPVVGAILPIGNFKGFNDTVGKIRTVIFKNLTYENNRIFFTL